MRQSDSGGKHHLHIELTQRQYQLLCRQAQECGLTKRAFLVRLIEGTPVKARPAQEIRWICCSRPWSGTTPTAWLSTGTRSLRWLRARPPRVAQLRYLAHFIVILDNLDAHRGYVGSARSGQRLHKRPGSP